MYPIVQKQRPCYGIGSALFFVVFFLSLGPKGRAQTVLAQSHDTAYSALSASSVTVMWYNCENFFDCENDSLKNDEDFLPKGSKHWSMTRYLKKQNQVATLICTIVAPYWPTFVGLCEIEHRSVLENLVHYPLKDRYGIAHFESPDRRGIDVGLLYKKDKFRLDTTFKKHVELESHYPTRDILVVVGELYGSADTLAVVLVHAPSKRGGARVSEQNRRCCLETLKQLCDSLRHEVTPYVMVMGDFNERVDEPALRWFIQATSFCDMTDPQNFQSYCYKGIWGSIDHILLSPSFIAQKNRVKQRGTNTPDSAYSARHCLTLQSFSIYRPSYLLRWDKSVLDSVPKRTYRGPFYLGGSSDHLPLRLILEPEP